MASAFAAATAVAVCGFGGTAYADYTKDLDGSTPFYTGVRGAEITLSDADGDGNTYAEFDMEDGETVAYRQSLAYSWLKGDKDEDDNLIGTATENRFSMEIGFANGDFDVYTIKFQSQQYVLTEETITENYIVFLPSTSAVDTLDVTLDVYITQEADDDTDYSGLTAVTTCAVGEKITISFGEYSEGGYPVTITCGENSGTGKFENVYEYYSSYVSSGDSAVTPLTFSATAKTDDGETDTTKVAKMVLYSLNGQSFKATLDDSGNVEVTDDTEPVICFTQTPSYLINGDAIDFDYKVIDVLSSTTRATAYYYVLNAEQYTSEDYDFDKTEYDDDDDNPFTEITSSSKIRIIRDENSYIPTELINDGVKGLVKIYYKISDRSSSSSSTANTDVVFVDWYAKEGSTVDIYDYKGDEDKTSSFIKLIAEDGKEGLTYAQKSDLTKTTSEALLQAYKDTITNFEKAYQAKITEAIEALTDEDGNVVSTLYAGSDSEFYLPSFEGLTWTDSDGNTVEFDLASTDDYYNAGDYKFSIYYKAKTSGSSTSLSPNNLSITLSEADVEYRFTIFITDSFGNSMRYPKEIDEETGEIVWEEITTDDVWDEDFAELLPYFSFYVDYKEATAEAPESLSLAYVDTSYSGVSFTINGVSSTYSTSYSLYIFDRNALTEDTGVNLGYDEFLEHIEELFNNNLENIDAFTNKTVNTRKYFTTVKPVDDLLETDDNYELFSDISWNATSISFTPQTVEDYYVVRLTLTDTSSQTKTYCYTAVAASSQANELAGESDWLEKNVVSVILFSIGGVCLIAFVLLLLIRPKDKGDIDAVYEAEIAKDDKKGKKKKKEKE